SHATALADARDGERLLWQHRYEDACPKLEASVAGWPRVRTLRLLAKCHAAQGKTASAFEEYMAASEAARRLHDHEGASRTERAARALAPKLAYLTIQPPYGDEIAGLEVRRDDAALAPETIGAHAAVDPGVHLVTATAPGRAPWKTELTIASGTETIVR